MYPALKIGTGRTDRSQEVLLVSSRENRVFFEQVLPVPRGSWENVVLEDLAFVAPFSTVHIWGSQFPASGVMLEGVAFMLTNNQPFNTL